ncbi:serine/threonine-protein kinase [Gemmata sp. JC717]|uniref:WD40 repeat domain-containing serine/threonine protein kinase n=1 Tax=Gemmata algarum TaxID=2975278 RepID=UPI0021BBA72B|nr:serine/threonine-protein kinase [Gemmata algarum]MDY3552643.1 serine/threonine-protein kinase [Gemmata algarum]
MVDRLACPESVRLPTLLDGRDPPRDLFEHLAQCPRCQHALECLAAGDCAWLRSPPAADADRPPHLRQLLDALTRLTTAADMFAVPPRNLSLDFLLPTDHPEALGAVGPYPVLEVVGRGGMGVVFRALDRALNRVIAVKVLAPQWAANGTARQRFLREARAAAAVAHEHVVSIHAVDESNGLPYLVMEYVPGPSLQERIDRDGPLDPKDVARVALQVAAGLAAAHAQGLVHRDVKPANILLENGVGRARLTDFGLARAVDDAGTTQHGTIAGTPDYMAPEQATGQLVDHRADLYALGCVIYAASTGRPPFRAATSLGVMHLTVTATPAPIRTLNPDIPPDLAAVALRLLAKDPADRFQTAETVAAELRAVLIRMQQPDLAPRRSKWRTRAVAGIVVTLTLIAAVLALRPRSDPPEITATDPGDSPQPLSPVAPSTLPGDLAPVMAFEGHRGTIPGLVVHPDGARFVSVGSTLTRDDGTIRLWNTASGKKTHQIRADGVRAECVALTPDGNTIVAGFIDGTVRIYEWDSETELVRLKADRIPITCVASDPAGRRIAIGDARGRLRIWDPATGRVGPTISAHEPRPCRGVAFAPDGKMVASVGLDGALRTWDVSTRYERLAVILGTDLAWGVSFASGGKQLVTADPFGAAVWSAETGHRLTELRDGRVTPSTAVAVSADGTAVATCGPDGFVRVWHTRTGALALRAAAGGPAWSVALTADGKHVLAGCGGSGQREPPEAGSTSVIRMWLVPTPHGR